MLKGRTEAASYIENQTRAKICTGGRHYESAIKYYISVAKSPGATLLCQGQIRASVVWNFHGDLK